MHGIITKVIMHVLIRMTCFCSNKKTKKTMNMRFVFDAVIARRKSKNIMSI